MYDSNQILDETGSPLFDEGTSGYAMKDETLLSPVSPIPQTNSNNTKMVLRIDNGLNIVDLYYH
jgi:hypothetical protein